MGFCKNVIEAIGHTPFIKLRHASEATQCAILSPAGPSVSRRSRRISSENVLTSFILIGVRRSRLRFIRLGGAIGLERILIGAEGVIVRGLRNGKARRQTAVE